jgi:hypothetical protein
VNLAYQIRIAQVQLVVAAIDVDTFRVKHGAHRAVEDEDAIGGEKFLKRLHNGIADFQLPIADL